MARDIAATPPRAVRRHAAIPTAWPAKTFRWPAAIVALADVYDALTSKRVYRTFLHTIARDIILKESGTHLDPEVVDAFRQVEAEFVEIRDRFQKRRP